MSGRWRGGASAGAALPALAAVPLRAPAAAERTARQVLDQDGYLLQMLLSLSAVLALIVAAAWVLRRFARLGGGSGGLLRIQAGLPLGGRERIVLVEAGGKHILLGVAPGRVVALHVFDGPLPPPRVEQSGGFAGRLGRALQEGGGG